MPWLSGDPLWETFGTDCYGGADFGECKRAIARVGDGDRDDWHREWTAIRFTAAEGAGGHCEGSARRLFHQRCYDWLDETLGM